jgi:hypothetical protein
MSTCFDQVFSSWSVDIVCFTLHVGSLKRNTFSDSHAPQPSLQGPFHSTAITEEVLSAASNGRMCFEQRAILVVIALSSLCASTQY